jgi:type II secretory ATPase GspE/PulE/Tfp pilus assembly ATPase PilB-like protein
LLEQQQTPEAIGKLLIRLGFISEATLRDALSEKLGEAGVDLASIVPDAAALQQLPHDLAHRHRVFPFAYDAIKRQLKLASADPHNLNTLDRLRSQLPPETQIRMQLAGETDIARAIDRHYGHTLAIDGILEEIETGKQDWQQPAGSGETPAHPIVRLIDAILADAVRQQASDIHFEPEAGFIRIRYRLDGTLRQIRALHKSYWPAMVVRLKVIAGMNIAENRAPQDGQLSMNISGSPVDFRCACQPTLHGENIVLRILDRQRGIVPLADLGLGAAQQSQLQRLMQRPEGLILVTGPTGSGKTTTLYAMINQINREDIHIMTLEDPVEYQMPQVRQTSVSSAARLDFADGIRSMMRQDPDVILVGEIRDGDTAKMASAPP